MSAWIVKWLLDIRASYWFVPSCMVVFAILLAWLLPQIDIYLNGRWPESLDSVTSTRTVGARAILTVIAGSIIGVAGVTFSITTVAVSFASANFGPRLIGNFMRDRGNQITLGTFIGTFVYTLLILGTVQDGAQADLEQRFDTFVPHLSLMIALLLVLVSVAVLIYFIHHVPETINVSRIAADLGRKLCVGVESPFPGEPEDREDRSADWSSKMDRTRVCVKSEMTGYIQRLSIDRLRGIAAEHDLLLEVRMKPGAFVIPSDTLVEIWATDSLEEGVEAKIQECYAVGEERTAHQNVLFIVDQLNEIVARALSPGVNDPNTAITCLNWNKAGVARFLEVSRESATRRTTNDHVRLHRLGFNEFAETVFQRIEPYICRDRNVAMHALKILEDLAEKAGESEEQDCLFRIATSLRAAASECLDDRSGDGPESFEVGGKAG